jgi:hypothetical protein
MYHFCTYFDRHYLARGLALLASLRAHVDDFRLYVLCFDDATYAYFRDAEYPDVEPIPLSALESDFPRLLDAKQNRTAIEYYFTCTPALPLFVMDRYRSVDVVTYVDADLYFFDSPAALYHALGEKSVLILGHRFSERLRHMEAYGVYNVGYLSFRNDADGRACLTTWRDQCADWCHDRLEGHRFADQKYLDVWPSTIKGVAVPARPGAGFAPWNVDNHTVTKKGDAVLVDGDRLIFYHFHGLRFLRRSVVLPGTHGFGNRVPASLRRLVYEPYIRELQRIRDTSSVQLGHGIRVPDSTFKGVWKRLLHEQLLVSFGSRSISADFSRPLSVTKRVFRGARRRAGLLVRTALMRNKRH